MFAAYSAMPNGRAFSDRLPIFTICGAFTVFLTELQLHILLISFKITVYSYIVAGIKSGTRIGINPNKISRFIFTKKDGKNNEKEKRERK